MLGGYFLADDFAYVGKYSSFALRHWPRLFTREWSEGLWGRVTPELRPITALTFIVDSRLWNANAFGFRLTNLCLHIICAGLVGGVAWRASRRDTGCGVAAAALFAVHPVHAEAVMWITGRVDLLATMFYLAGFAAFLRYREERQRRWLVLLWMCYPLAAFSKEFGLTLPLMALLADVADQKGTQRWRQTSAWMPYAGWLVALLAYYACRREALGTMDLNALARPDSTLLLELCRRQLIYVGSLVPLPHKLLADIAMAHPVSMWLMTIAVAAATLLAWSRWQTGKTAGDVAAVAFYGVGWYLVATLPLVVTYISARHLYLASAGACVTCVLMLRGLTRQRWHFAAAVVVLAAACDYRLAASARPWHDAAALSGRIREAVISAAQSAEPGSALLLDVPGQFHGAYLWAWASPFSVRPPFADHAVDQRLVVIETPGAYFDPQRWRQQPAQRRLLTVEARSWLVQVRDDGTLRGVAISSATLRAAATSLAASAPALSDDDAWRRLVDAVSMP
jgi:hypothetical protein